MPIPMVFTPTQEVLIIEYDFPTFILLSEEKWLSIDIPSGRIYISLLRETWTPLTELSHCYHFVLIMSSVQRAIFCVCSLCRLSTVHNYCTVPVLLIHFQPNIRSIIPLIRISNRSSKSRCQRETPKVGRQKKILSLNFLKFSAYT